MTTAPIIETIRGYNITGHGRAAALELSVTPFSTGGVAEYSVDLRVGEKTWSLRDIGSSKDVLDDLSQLCSLLSDARHYLDDHGCLGENERSDDSPVEGLLTRCTDEAASDGEMTLIVNRSGFWLDASGPDAVTLDDSDPFRDGSGIAFCDDALCMFDQAFVSLSARWARKDEDSDGSEKRPHIIDDALRQLLEYEAERYDWQLPEPPDQGLWPTCCVVVCASRF